MAAFFLGLCVGQVMTAPCPDRFGRRWPILIGLFAPICGRRRLRPGAGTADPGRRPSFEAVGGCAGTVLGARLRAPTCSAAAGGAHLRQMLLILSVSPLVSRLRRRLAVAADRLAQPVLAASGAALLTWGFVWWLLAGKPSRLGPAAEPVP